MIVKILHRESWRQTSAQALRRGGAILLALPLLAGAAPNTSTAEKSHRSTHSAPASSSVMRNNGQEKQKHGGQQGEVVRTADGLRIHLMVGAPLRWYTLEQGTLVLKEPTRDETLGLTISIEDAASGQVFPSARVKFSIREAVSGNTLVTTTTLAPVWDGRRTVYLGNVALPESLNGTRPQILVAVEAEPVEGVGRSVDVPESFFRKPVATEFGPFDVSATKKEGAAERESTKPLSAQLPGRHAPIEPTPYLGAKKSSLGEK